MRARLTTLLAFLCFVAVVASARAISPTFDPPPTGVIFYVDPTGGIFEPSDSSGSSVTIQNSGRITITNQVSGQVAFQKELSWSNAKNEPPSDYWSFDSRAIAPGLYSYCGIIDPGYGYPGSTTCRSYFADINRLYSFKRGRNSSTELIIPMRIDPALVGQQIQVKIDWFRASPAPRQSKDWSPPFSGWRKIATRRQQLTLQPGQVLRTGQRLINNRKVVVTFSFPSIPGTSDPDGDEIHWARANNCVIAMHGAVKGSWTIPFPGVRELRHADFVGKKKPCTLQGDIEG